MKRNTFISVFYYKDSGMHNSIEDNLECNTSTKNPNTCALNLMTKSLLLTEFRNHMMSRGNYNPISRTPIFRNLVFPFSYLLNSTG